MYFLPLIFWLPIIVVIVNIKSRKIDRVKKYRLGLIIVSFILTFLSTYGIYVFTNVMTKVIKSGILANSLWLLYMFFGAPALFTIIGCLFLSIGGRKSDTSL
ncbi:hypothetical protein SAMN05518672_11580 [Chitinophaga sp. CF118]|nr:hypothetical protein SAMN05518672_11580 [Chitinophaga sp. CF118]